MRLIAGLAALSTLLAVTASATAQDARPKGVQRVYDDYRDDGVIDACKHPKRALQRTLDTLAPEADVDTPDLRPALEAAIEQHNSGDCTPEQEATPTPTPSTTPSPAVTPAPSPAPEPSSTPAPPPAASGGGGGGGGGGTGAGGIAPSAPPAAGDISPVVPNPTLVPPAVTPAVTPVPVTPPAAVEPTGPPPAPAVVYANPDDGLPASLLVPAVLLALVALLALLYAVLSRLGWADARLAGVRRAWREAAFRAGGTWGDFGDWMRPGR
jgi:hypothetical protein